MARVPLSSKAAFLRSSAPAMPLLPRPGALLLLALCLAPTRALGQVGEEERVFTGHVYTADGATADGVVVSVRGGMGADSLRVDSTGAFTLALPAFPATPVRLAARADGADDRYYPLLLRIGASQRGDGLALILIPRQWTPAAGRYAGVPVAVDPVAATAATCRTCTGFWRGALGDSLPGRAPGIPSWPDSAFPIRVAIDPEVGPRMTPRDSIDFWRAARALEDIFGRRLFEPASVEAVLDPPEDDPHGVMLVSLDPTLRGDGWGSSAAQGGDLLGAAVLLRTRALLSGPNAEALVGHELMHALGFGHTCAWRSVVSDQRCPGQRAARASPQDVAHVEVLWAVRRLERRYGTSQTVRATLAALRPPDGPGGGPGRPVPTNPP
jgi:hypothetical protein